MNTTARRHQHTTTRHDYNEAILELWEAAFTEIADTDRPDTQEGLREKRRFEMMTGATENSPLAIAYLFFRAGVGKGLEWATAETEARA